MEPKTYDKRFNPFLIPIMLTVALLPIVTRLYFGQTRVFEYTIGPALVRVTDMYLQWKVFCFAALSLTMLILGGIQIYRMDVDERLRLFKRFSPLIAYLFFILLSTLFSINRQAALLGEHNQHEPAFVLIGYCVLVLYTFITVHNRRDVNIIISSVIVGAVLISIIGITEAFKIKLGDFEFVRLFTIPRSLSYLVDGTLYPDIPVDATLFNQNYVGSFVCLTLPFPVMLVLGQTKLWHKAVGLIVSAMLVYILIKSRGTTGYLAVFVVAFVVAIFQTKNWIKKWYLLIPLILLSVFIFYRYNKATGNILSEKIKSIVIQPKQEFNLKGIDTTKNFVEIFYKDYDLRCEFKQMPEIGPYGLVCERFGKPLDSITLEDGTVVVSLPDGSTLNFYPFAFEDGTGYGYAIQNEIGVFIKLVNENNDYKYVNPIGLLRESFVYTKLLDGKEDFASGRGILWREALSFVPHYVFVGAGADCYPFAVHKDGTDTVAQARLDDESYTFRPHNYYLQMAINTGLFSLLSVLTFLIWYFVDCAKLFFLKKQSGWMYNVGVACFASVLGFLCCGFANDSLIVVSPIFWAVLGLGMTANSLINKTINQ